MADSASSTFPGDRHTSDVSSYPMRVENWRGCVAELLTETDHDINSRRWEAAVVYIDFCLQLIATAGSELTTAAGELAVAA